MKTRILALAAMLLTAGSASAGEATVAGRQPQEVVRLLTVGNSFSKNATRFLGDLAAAGGHRLIHRPIVVSGASLELHATKAQAHERDPKDEAGLYASGRSLKQELQDGPWDFVTVQQASIKSHDVETFRPYAAWLRDYILRHAPGARVLIHQTWAYRRDDPRFTNPSGEPGAPESSEAMFRGIREAYGTIARELGLGLIPVGEAFFLAGEDPEWGFKHIGPFDFKEARPPSLPEQAHSLHVGWQWKALKDGTRAIRMDGHHANTAGEYLGGCVWFEVLFGESAVGNPFVPSGLDPSYARFLQETAHRAAAGVSTQEDQTFPGRPSSRKARPQAP